MSNSAVIFGGYRGDLSTENRNRGNYIASLAGSSHNDGWRDHGRTSQALGREGRLARKVVAVADGNAGTHGVASNSFICNDVSPRQREAEFKVSDSMGNNESFNGYLHDDFCDRNY